MTTKEFNKIKEKIHKLENIGRFSHEMADGIITNLEQLIEQGYLELINEYDEQNNFQNKGCVNS